MILNIGLTKKTTMEKFKVELVLYSFKWTNINLTTLFLWNLAFIKMEAFF
jgi:hypothetical protein